MITTGEMIPLGTCFATLTPFDSRQLLESTMQCFHLPAHVVRVLNGLRGEHGIKVIGDNPVNVAVCGNQLE